jgi:excisionase family DNA binding protein
MGKVDVLEVARARENLRALFRDNPGLRLPTDAEVEEMAGWLYTPDQVAALCQVTAETVRRWLRDGTLKGVQLPRNVWRVHEDHVRSLLSLPADAALASPAELDARRSSAPQGQGPADD